MSNAISINNSVLMGRLTRDPELRYTKNNRPVATFRPCHRNSSQRPSACPADRCGWKNLCRRFSPD